ncbi:draxin-A [Scleropages formosus]|uniref:draxin-A n=1 Tax=Scleropages formosus TaxID=113540 RepID=UPI0010FA9250|nr:draxin-A-like [Scleropages formosus]
MAALFRDLGLLLLLTTLAVSSSYEPTSRLPKKGKLASPGRANTLQALNLWMQQGLHPYRRSSRVSGGLPSRHSSRLLWGNEDAGMGPEGLEPVKLERGPVGEKENDFGARTTFHQQDNHAPGSEAVPKHWRHQFRSGYEKLMDHRGPVRHGKGDLAQVMLASDPREAEIFEDQSLRVASTGNNALPSVTPSTAVVSSSISLVTTVTCEEPKVLPQVSTKPQKPPAVPASWKAQGEVMPTLDMALFDWTDYEDLRPADTWRDPRKKDKRRSKNLKPGNMTMDREAMKLCDHHLDCRPGSCCDLRNHVCTPHNRGLNNKCYDDCMCEEGFRCYAKFHRKRRVTRRRGRCVEPESADREQGAFITI